MSVENVKKAIAIINQHQEDADFEGIKDASLIALAEKTLDVNFPDGYKFFLQTLGCGDIAGQEFYGVIKADFINSGIPDAIWLTLKERLESSLPKKYVVISATGDGDYVVLDCCETSEKKVMLWTPGIENQQIAFRPYYSDFGDFFYDQIIKVLS